MRKTKITFFTLCFALLAAVGQAQTPVTIYSGASLPANQGWNELRLDSTINPVAAPASATVGDGVLKLTSTNGVDTFSQLGWYKNNLGLDLSKGYTVEIKAKLNVAGKGAFNIQGFDNEGKGFRIGISETQLTNQSNPLNPTTLIKDGLTNDSEFHIYRLAVATSGIVTVYRDAAQIGTFALSAFDFDNIIENGGFEDAEFPDFRSNAVLEKSPVRPFAGQSALLMNSDGKNNQTDPKEGATTRAFPLKPDTDYEFSMTRRRAILDNEWAWRDFGAYWNTQEGSVTTPAGTANAEPRERWWNNCFENRHWLTGTETFNKGDDAEKNTIRFEFPSWIRDGKNTSKVAIDNVVFREKPTLTVLPTVTTASFKLEPDFHEGYVNLIQNGGFEDHAINNDGTEYAWALSDGTNSNEPVADNPMWGDNVRIQQNNKPDDFNNGDEPYAHSGTSSLRFTTLDNNSKNIDFRVALAANKTYRFHFWHRNPKWNDWGWLRVRIGEGGDIWQHRMGDRSNKWTPVDLVFTTTETDTILHLYTTSDTHGGWFNHYFDDFVLYEIPEGTPLDPQLDGKTNLIANGDFEDVTKNNDGSDYDWALASQDEGSDSDFPMAYNELWGTWLRIQDKEKRGTDYWGDRDDTGLQWAHSGTKSIRFTFEDNFDGARTFQGLTGDQYPDAYRINMNFKKELEPNKTYTFVFWIQVSCWNDRGWFHIANGDIKIVSQELNNRYMNWTRQSVTFSTTASNHTLRIFTEFGGWFNFYLDDLFLYEEDVYQPELAPVCNGDSYLFFGKSQNTASTDVEIEYVKIDATGTYMHIVYNSNGGQGIVADSTYNTATGAITLPAPTKTGYTFAGWYDNEGLTGDAVTTIPTGSAGDKELYAKWQAVAYTITYNVNGGVAIPAGTYTIESEAITLPAPTKANHIFQGWYDNEEFTGDAVTAIPAGSTGNKEFWAKWKDNTGLDTLDGALRIYPNPVVNGKLTIENISPENRKIEVYSVIGTLARVYDVTASSTTIDLSALPAGTYIVKVSGKTAKILKK